MVLCWDSLNHFRPEGVFIGSKKAIAQNPFAEEIGTGHRLDHLTPLQGVSDGKTGRFPFYTKPVVYIPSVETVWSWTTQTQCDLSELESVSALCWP
jgi:hypothetical protein